jgi:hypothetical protein
MGQKQKAFIAQVEQHQEDCYPAIADLAEGIEQLRKIDVQIAGANNIAAINGFKNNRNPHFKTLIKARQDLKPHLAAYEKSVADLEKFVAKKAERADSKKKSLPIAQAFLSQCRIQLKDIKKLLDDSLKVKTD